MTKTMTIDCERGPAGPVQQITLTLADPDTVIATVTTPAKPNASSPPEALSTVSYDGSLSFASIVVDAIGLRRATRVLAFLQNHDTPVSQLVSEKGVGL